jgi:hypothetical protein
MGIMELGLQGQAITEASLDYAVLLRTDVDSEIRIESALSVHSNTGTHHISPEDATEEDTGRVAALAGATITTAVAEQDGTLRLAFSGDTRLDVGPNDTYEAWTIAGPHGRKIVCMPGGEIAVWAPDEA